MHVSGELLLLLRSKQTESKHKRDRKRKNRDSKIKADSEFLLSLLAERTCSQATAGASSRQGQAERVCVCVCVCVCVHKSNHYDRLLPNTPICQDKRETQEGRRMRWQTSSHILKEKRNKMKNNEYESVEHVDSDLTLMFENAKRYNVPHSSIYKRALKLQHIQQVSSSAFLSQLWDFWEASHPFHIYILPVVCVDEEKGAFAKRWWWWRQHALLSHVRHQ